MAKVYFDKLNTLVAAFDISDLNKNDIEVKHFFSGAALYFDKKLCVSWSPLGLAFKLPNRKVESLISSGEAIPLKYFPKGHVKKAYVLFPNPEEKSAKHWQKYFRIAIKHK